MARVAKSFRVEPEAQKKPSVKKKITKNKTPSSLTRRGVVRLNWRILALKDRASKKTSTRSRIISNEDCETGKIFEAYEAFWSFNRS